MEINLYVSLKQRLKLIKKCNIQNVTMFRYNLTVLLLFNLCFITKQFAETSVITNKMRYASHDDRIAADSFAVEQIIDATSPSETNNYRLNRVVSNGRQENEILDSEDKSLLDKFYRETKAEDPFLSDSLSIESLWADTHEQEMDRLNAFLDTNNQVDQHVLDDKQVANGADDGWTIDPELIYQSKMSSSEKNAALISGSQANYSPTLKLLISYDPITESAKQAEDGAKGISQNNRIVGATLFGQHAHLRPNVSSKSPVEAVKLHDDLFKTPPKDGKVRVRMYFHRAIHDDTNLYGNGPWKYWGHGWGIEFGYDPRGRDKNDFYQKGYTIERAFGRDFCKDPANCRQPDPNFFKDPYNVGDYSKRYAQTKPKVRAKLSQFRRN